VSSGPAFEVAFEDCQGFCRRFASFDKGLCFFFTVGDYGDEGFIGLGLPPVYGSTGCCLGDLISGKY